MQTPYDWIPSLKKIDGNTRELPVKGCTAFSITNLGTAFLKIGDYELDQNESVPFSGPLNGVCAINVPINWSTDGTRSALLSIVTPTQVNIGC